MWDFVFGQEMLHKLIRVRWCVVKIFQSPDDNFSSRLRRIESRRRRRTCNNIPYLLFDPLQRNHDAQHRLDRDNCERQLRLASKLASLSADVRPSL